MLVFILIIVGALNWGLVGLGWLVSGANWNVVNLLVGKWQKAEAIIYLIIGLAGLYKIVVYNKCCGKEDGSCCSGN